MSYANAAHQRGETYGKTLAEFMGATTEGSETDMQEGTLTLLLEMAERGRAEVAAAPPRSAEEIALEMVSDPHPTWHWARIFGAEFSSATPDGIKTARRNVALLITQARADGAAAALAGQQPRDLVGRIRAMVQQKAGEWADEPDMERTKVRLDILRILRLALAHAKSCGLVDYGYVEDLRSRASSWRSYADVSANATQAADELETIVRECAPTEGT